ncbi:acetate--CoA ligase [Humidisolicoccus flavus]|uniref:acetate--CoA ligase n=1 Tax=Humidisolicoccus flavus TaxID=3111414 RepID=UPI0032432B4C
MSQANDHSTDDSRRYPPSDTMQRGSTITSELYTEANDDRLEYWATQARTLDWESPFNEILDWQPPHAKWFADGTLNVAFNCLDRHVIAGLGDKVALHWEGEPGDQRTITYAELTAEVQRLSNVLLDHGVRAGDRVAIYLPMLPEAIAAMLACARIGAVHSAVFGGFSASNLRSRIDDAEISFVITADGAWRKGKVFPLKPVVDEALATPGHKVSGVLVVRRGENEIEWVEGRDHWYHDAMASAEPEHIAEAFPAEHPLFILYTSGTTGKPKGILHTSGGYLTQASATHRQVFDLRDDDVYWCTADIGWITGHSYIVYGPMANATTQVMHEGTFDTPTPHRPWEIIERYGVTIFYTAPTAIRTFMKIGREYPNAHDLSSLRVLGSVGEPINPEAWRWYFNVIGGGKAPIVDTWWQTETGAIMVSPLASVTSLQPGSAQVPVPGIEIEIVDDQGDALPDGESGLLVIREPWPSMLRGIWGDEERFVETYWSRFGDIYFAGDGAKKDENGDIWLLGRVDDVMNVSGHRLSTAEIESALVLNDIVAEAAVVGAHDDTTGQAVVAFVILKERALEPGIEDAAERLRQHVGEQIGAIAKPRQVFVVSELPKTRSGKIMRRLLRDIAEGRDIGDTTTLADTQVMQVISAQLR